ncbi:MAG: dihydropteroate synthase [Alphaproteobacteria bacterium]|jgi:5-methyltetrahydrofolate--homocysteine methyltransferase|nr:dihydropteroate synthase [Alphaproteobacteria bacterium]MDP6590856.1 dihydropteroate synthase [Alphaproteobacteria bacterium]
MDSISSHPGNYIAIGENIHTTRVLLRKGKRIAGEDGAEVILYQAADGSARQLPIPDSYKSTQDYDEGRVKHVKIALAAAMRGAGAEAENGLDYLRALAHHQERAGATFLDINVDEFSLKTDEQKAAMQWLVGAVQNMSELPVSVDSSDVEVIRAGLEAYQSVNARPMLNSASLERPDALDLALAHNAEVVVTAAGEKGMPSGTAERVANASRMIDAALEKGLQLGDIHVDPLVFPISVDKDFGLHCLDAIRELRAKYGSEIHLTGGMSNVSFGIPGRRIVNDTFVILAVAAGADGGIIDPVLSSPSEIFAMDRESLGYRLAEDMLLGKDEHCKKYIRAWRKGEMKAGAAR